MLMQAKLETVDCPCCESDGHRHWASENGYDAVKCTGCGTVYIRGRRDAQYAVRIFGDTGKTRLLKFVHRTGHWSPL